MTTRPLCAFALVALAACAPSVPDSGAGVGFGDYNSYLRESAAAPAPVTPAPVAGFDPAAASAAIDRAGGMSSTTPLPGPAPAYAASTPVYTGAEADRPRGDAPAGIKVESGEVAHSNPAGISDENDFSAVSSRETIESDKERIARNRSEYVVVQPKDLPTRPGDSGPNIVEYALATQHAPGTQMYSRGSLIKKDPNVACAKFASPDLAQAEFLSRGGPDKDRLGLDPDGDGFACGWDPRPFRTALQ